MKYKVAICIVAGGQFTIYMKFDEYYNERPPEVHFYTIPFHPNSKFSFALSPCCRSGLTVSSCMWTTLVYPWKKPVQDKQFYPENG